MSTSHTVAPLEPITFDRDRPARYRRWSVRVDGEVATVTMAVDPDGGLRADYQLRLKLLRPRR
ncbi:MAG: hypothetical protein R2749_18645 [Acidimicrobiales bacterium]